MLTRFAGYGVVKFKNNRSPDRNMGISARASLVLDVEAFLDHIAVPIAREPQLTELRACYRGALAKVRPLHVWAYGASGTGKTLCVRHLLDTEVLDAGVLPVYVNCRERFTLLDIVEQILGAQRSVPDPRRSRERQLALLRSSLRGRRCVIALDAVDTLRQADMAQLLHHLLVLPKISVLCVATSCLPLARLPEAVRSRLAPRRVCFPLYQSAEMMRILTECSERALHAGTWELVALEKVATHARGDARRGLALLRHAVQRADEARAKRLQANHLVPGNFTYFDPRVEDELGLLSSHDRILYDLICTKGPINSTHLDHEYRSVCVRQRLPPVSSRTLNKYLGVLSLKRILVREHGAGTGAWIYRAAGTTTDTRDTA